jgi:hypothetical protein
MLPSLQELSPGLWHWKVLHRAIGADVSSYFLRDERVLIDPMIPGEGLGWFTEFPPEHVLLTSRHHDRQAWRFREAFDCRIHCGLEAVDELQERGPINGFAFGADLPGGITALEISAIFPGETAFHIPRHRALAFGDGAIRHPSQDTLTFIPDRYMDNPTQTKPRLRQAYGALLTLNFDVLLLAHGDPVLEDARQALETFVGEG